ncbi:hypothetical protein BofuT4_uP125260.1 [Botrytis cinerea T4]|uniref:Uncharacterized protein n=1 Tax=Botryotinia fuckeliana (strain T4) TaxID=999810 RepID=G2YS80_BOTF4|nr:hypothetical protein BofuT4_uP125260.1 [Botrytis cinerea T4]
MHKNTRHDLALDSLSRSLKLGASPNSTDGILRVYFHITRLLGSFNGAQVEASSHMESTKLKVHLVKFQIR